MDTNSLSTSTAMAKGQTIAPDTEEPKPISLVCGRQLDSMISDAAKAQGENDLPAEIQELKKSGLLSPVGGLSQILNRCNDSIFAGVHIDGKGNRFIHFRQQYADGEYSTEYVIPQSSLLIVAYYRKTGNPAIKQEATKALRAITMDYFSKSSSNEPLNIPEAMDALCEVLRQLPIINREYELSAVELYAEIIEILKTMGGIPSLLDVLRDEKRGYLVLDENYLDEIARNLQMPRRQLLEQLKKNHLLYLTGSCRGYQCKIPYTKNRDGSIRYEWAYCLYDLEYLNKYSNGSRPAPEFMDLDC